MQSLAEVQLHNFQQALTPARLREMRTVYIALGAGVLVFGFVIWNISTVATGRAPAEDTLRMMMILSIVHAVFALSVYAVSNFIYNLQFRPSRLERSAQEGVYDPRSRRVLEDPAVNSLMIIRVAAIIRLALLEGVAFFGLAICMMGVKNGVMEIQPAYWLNALSAVVMLAFVAATFPTRERVEEIFRRKIQGLA